MMTAAESHYSRPGLVAMISAFGSLFLCFSQTSLAVAMAAIGVDVPDAIDHVQAVLMWVVALLAVACLALDRKNHQANAPLVLGVAGLVVLVGTLYVYYDWRILTLAYVLLVASVFLNQIATQQSLYETVQDQAEQLAELSQSLAERVDEQGHRIGRLDKLKRFLSPHVVQLVTEAKDDTLLESHRQYVTILFCDLRGFTAFAEKMEPEETIELLQTYHEEMGKLVFDYDGTIDHRAGDGLMVIFNDPVPCDAPVEQALRLAFAMRDKVREMAKSWQKHDYDLGFGIGITSGYATLGIVGFEGRFDYTANGNVVNLAARLCDIAKNDQIIINHRAYTEVEDEVKVEPLSELELKGIRSPVRAFNVIEFLRKPEKATGDKGAGPVASA